MLLYTAVTVHTRLTLGKPSAPSPGFGWLSHSPLLKGDMPFFSAPVAQSTMRLMLVSPLLGLLLAAIQFTKQAEEYQKVGASCGPVSRAVQMAVGSNESRSWQWGGVGLGSLEQEQKRRKRERKRGKKLSLGSDKLSAWLRVLVELQPEMHIFPCIVLQLGKCRPVQFPVLNYLMIIHGHVCLCALISHL